MTTATCPLPHPAGQAATPVAEPPMAQQGNGAAPVVCAACGGENAPDAVFCANAACRKSLGEFRYVAEELQSMAQWHETVAEKVTEFIGRPHFLVVHGLWFALWIAINTGIIAFVHQFDEYPFGLLGIILAAEAVLITGFILISSNRQSVHADKRAELDYEASVRTYRELREVDEKLTAILARLDRWEAARDSRPAK